MAQLKNDFQVAATGTLASVLQLQISRVSGAALFRRQLTNRGLVIVLLAAFGVGCERTPTPSATENIQLANRNESLDARLLPAGFTRVSADLLVKSLNPTAEPASAQPKNLFEQAAQSTIKFANFFSPARNEKYLDTGSGVALGDFDNDGLPDIYFVGSDVPNRLYRNLGNLEFEDVTSDAGVNGRIVNQNVLGSGATFADIDNDGDLDLFVCNMSASNLMYVNQGDGTFLEQTYARGLKYIGASKMGSFCDYDRDGDLDLYLVTYRNRLPQHPPRYVDVAGEKTIAPDQRGDYKVYHGHTEYSGERDILYRNRGDGTFEDVTESAGVVGFDQGLASVWLDHDNDGWPDLYVSNDFKDPDHLYRNNRDGTFTDIAAACFRHTPWFSMGVDAGDLNNDGSTDLLTTDMAATTHFKQKLGMGSMEDSNWFLNFGAPRQYMKNSLQINTGVGPYFEMASMAGLSSTDWTWSVRLADLNNNGRLDVLVTNGHARDRMNADVLDQFKKRVREHASMSEIQEMEINIPKLNEQNLAFENMGGLEFKNVSHRWGFDHVGISHGLAMGDLDLDGDLDLVMNNYYEPAIVYQNQSTDGARLILEFRCQSNNRFGYGTRVDLWQGDHYQTKTLFPARGYLSSDEPILHFGIRSDAPIDRLKITWPDGSTQEHANLSGGNRYRVLESANRQQATTTPKTKPLKPMFTAAENQMGLDFVHRENKFDDFAREPLLPFRLSRLGGGVAIGDINHDGRPDIYCGGAAQQTGQLFVSKNGTYESISGPWNDDRQCEDMGALFFDADNDGDLDLYVVSGGTEFELGNQSYEDRLYLNQAVKQPTDGAENKNEQALLFQRSPEALPKLTDSGSAIAAADFDHDGDLDLFVGSRSIPGQYPLSPTSRLLVNENGKFSVASEEITGGLSEAGLVSSALWSDVDGDGWIDLVLAVEWGPVTIFRNVEGRFENVTEKLGLAKHLGWWHGVAAADLDQDGDMDYVVTNHGRNTKYHADQAHPHRLYYDDFDDNGTLDLVEAKYEGDAELPVRGRSCSSNAMPFIAEKFKDYQSFASASLLEIYDIDTEERSWREVNWLDSSILWNDGGKFRIQSLPYLAQISPAFGVHAADYDADGIIDLMVANNFYSNQVETGFMDGGLGWFLKGKQAIDGAEFPIEFEPIWPNRSGLVLAGDNKGLATADIDADGDLDVLIQENNGPLRVLLNQSTVLGQSKDAPRQVQLIARQNRSAIGTRIVLEGTEAKKVIELSAGGSYLSQSDLTMSFVLSPADAKRFDRLTIHWPDGRSEEHSMESLGSENRKLVFRQQE